MTQENEAPIPWVDILVKPRKTIDWILINKSSIIIVLILLYLDGVVFGIGKAESAHYGDTDTIYNIITSALLISGLGGLIVYNISIWTISIAASWFGGKGNFKKTQIAYAWSTIPSIIFILITFIAYQFLNIELFTSATPYIHRNPSLMTAYLIYGALTIILTIWQVTLVVITISEVQKFSILKSILSIITGALLLIAPFIILVLLIKVL